MTRRYLLATVAVLGLAAVLRFAALDRLPPGLFFDEAANLFDIQEVLDGARPIFFPRNNGREPLFLYWQALFVAALGPDAFALRLAAAVLGWLTVPAVLFCAWALTKAEGQSHPLRVALLAALALAGLYWHVHFSRFGLRTISLPLFAATTVGLLWWAVRRRRFLLWGLAGASGGLALYTYTSSRVVPVVALLGVLLAARKGRPVWGGAALMVGVWALVFAPLGLYFLGRPADFFKHAADVSALNPANHHGDPWGALWDGVWKNAAMFLFVGSASGAENLPHRPLLDPFVGALFVVGVVVATLRLRTPTRAFLLGWLVLGVLPSVLSVNPPGYFRISGAIPAVAVLVGLGASHVWELAEARLPTHLRGIAGPLVVGVLLVGAGLTARDYFAVWGPSDVAYRAMMADKVDVARHLNAWTSTERVFLAPLYAQDFTIQFLTRDRPPDTFDMGTTMVLPSPSPRAVRYVFPIFDEEHPARLRPWLPSVTREEISYDSTGRRALLRSLVVDGRDLPSPPSQPVALLGDLVALLEHVASPAARAGEALGVRIVWLALEPMATDYTVFLHLRDAGGQTRAQYDGLLARGAFPTTRWRPGDRVVEQYELALPADLPPGTYRLVAGLYELSTLVRLPARSADGRDLVNEVPLGEVRVTP